jgi:hypothetical protein
VEAPQAAGDCVKAGALASLLRDRTVGPLTAWDLAPRRIDLERPRLYREGMALHRTLYRGGYTMTSSRRGRSLYRLAADVDRRGVPGAVVDCGVWNGGSTALLSAGAPGREVWAFDSFEGLPPPGPLDGEESTEWSGKLQGSEARVREAVARHGRASRLVVRKGWFEDTLPEAVDQIGPIAVLHCDGDWYASVRLTLEAFYPKVSSGGYIVIDDYGHWPGASRAADEFRRDRGDEAPLVKVDYTGRYWRKP